jgi:hypothetical protein
LAAIQAASASLVGGGLDGSGSGPGRDDERVVAVTGEAFGDTQDAVRDAVDIGRERLGDDRDPHGHKVRYQPIGASQPP